MPKFVRPYLLWIYTETKCVFSHRMTTEVWKISEFLAKNILGHHFILKHTPGAFISLKTFLSVLTTRKIAMSKAWLYMMFGLVFALQLLRELQAHNGFVNCLCFNAPGNTMYSCDSVGTVITWKVDLAPQTMAGTLDSTDTVAITNASEWIQERIFTDPEISVCYSTEA